MKNLLLALLVFCSFALPAQAGCGSNAECPGSNWFCLKGECVQKFTGEHCWNDVDCAIGNRCVSGVCVASQPVLDFSGACNGNGDCNTGEVCINGWCSGGSIIGGSCNGNGDCKTGEICINGWCS